MGHVVPSILAMRKRHNTIYLVGIAWVEMTATRPPSKMIGSQWVGQSEIGQWRTVTVTPADNVELPAASYALALSV